MGGIIMTLFSMLVPFAVLWDMINLGVLLGFNITNTSLLLVVRVVHVHLSDDFKNHKAQKGSRINSLSICLCAAADLLLIAHFVVFLIHLCALLCLLRLILLAFSCHAYCIPALRVCWRAGDYFYSSCRWRKNCVEKQRRKKRRCRRCWQQWRRRKQYWC